MVHHSLFNSIYCPYFFVVRRGGKGKELRLRETWKLNFSNAALGNTEQRSGNRLRNRNRNRNMGRNGYGVKEYTIYTIGQWYGYDADIYVLTSGKFPTFQKVR